jgi:hypothetical protein
MGGGVSAPVVRPSTTDIFDDGKVPRPDQIDVNTRDLFASAPGKYDPGLYVFVRDGRVVLADAGKEVIVEPGEGAYADGKGGAPGKIEAPMSIKYDPWLLHTSNICR